MRNETPLFAAPLLLAILLGWPSGTLGAQQYGPANDVMEDTGLVAVTFPAAAIGRVVFECPASLDASSKVTAVPKGWIPVAGKTRFPFDRISVSDANPEDPANPEFLAELVPDRDLEESKDGKTAVVEWQFAAGGAKNVWIACSYSGTPSSLAVQVPNGTLRCTTISRRVSQRWGMVWERERKIVCSVNRLTREKSTNGNDFLIVPGTSLGKIHLGVSKAEVIALLGKPNRRSSNSSMVYASKSGKETEIFLSGDKVI